MGLKFTPALQGVLNNLSTFAEEQLKELKPNVHVQLNHEQLVTLTEGFTAKLSTGEERGVTVSDVEAVDIFNRDLHDAVKYMAGKHGSEFLKEHEEETSFKFGVELPELAGHGRTVTGAFYRPVGEGEDNSDNYTAVTTKWNQSEDGKAIDAELDSLRKTLRKK